MPNNENTASVYEYLNIVNKDNKQSQRKDVIKYNLAKYMLEQQKAENNANILELLLA